MNIEIIVVLVIILASVGIVVYDKYVVLKKLKEMREGKDEINEEIKGSFKDVSH